MQSQETENRLIDDQKLKDEQEYLKIRLEQINRRSQRMANSYNDMNDKTKSEDGHNPVNSIIHAFSVEMQDMNEAFGSRLAAMDDK